eukprot:6179863-Pleurochrysis_carterae.AAC.2
MADLAGATPGPEPPRRRAPARAPALAPSPDGLSAVENQISMNTPDSGVGAWLGRVGSSDRLGPRATLERLFGNIYSSICKY